MRKRGVLFLVVGLLALAGCGDDDDDDDGRVTAAEGQIRNFGANPMTTADCTHPEGVAVDDRGNIWAGSTPGAGNLPGPARICRLNDRGQVIDRFDVSPGASGVANIGGLFFVPGDGLYFTDFGDFNAAVGNKRVLRLDPVSRAITTLDATFFSPNAITRDATGNLYVSDSQEGAIYRFARTSPGAVTGPKALWKQDPLLTTTGQPPFGANGLAFDQGRQFLYVSNTGNSSIVRIANSADPAQRVATEVATNASLGGGNALRGADGIAFDTAGDLYVCANGANEIQVLSVTGTPQFVRRFNTGDALLFPASIAFLGTQAYIANLAFGTPGEAGYLSVIGSPTAGLVP